MPATALPTISRCSPALDGALFLVMRFACTKGWGPRCRTFGYIYLLTYARPTFMTAPKS